MSPFDKWVGANISPHLCHEEIDAELAFEAGMAAGREGLIRGLCCHCEEPVPPDTGDLFEGDLLCDECV